MSDAAISRFIVSSAVVVLVLSIALPAFAEPVQIDPRATFLRTHEDPDSVDTQAIELAQLGLSAGDMISIERIGEFDFGAQFPEHATFTIAVFSASDTLLASDDSIRVPDAIDP